MPDRYCVFSVPTRSAARVLEPEQQQQQDHADLGAGGNELLARVQRQQTAVPERQSGQQIKGNRREADPAGDPAEDAEGKE